MEGRDDIIRGAGVDGRGGVEEVGAGLDAAHGPGGAVVGAGGLLGGVEGAEPAPLLRLRVADLGGVPAPGAATDAAVPDTAGGGGGGGGLVGGAALWGGGGEEEWVGVGAVEPSHGFFHDLIERITVVSADIWGEDISKE